MFAPISREGSLLLNNLLLATACATVLLGTLYPLILETINGQKISVGPPYFNATFGPLMIPLLIAVPIGSMIAWKRGDLMGVLGRLKVAVIITVVIVVAHLFWTQGKSALAVLGLGVAWWVIFGSLVELAERIQLFRVPFARSMNRAKGLPRSAYAMAIAHMGLGVMMVGVVGSSAWQSERILVMKPGDSVELAGYDFTLDDVSEYQGPNYVGRRADIRVTSDGDPVAVLQPEKRFYQCRGPAHVGGRHSQQRVPRSLRRARRSARGPDCSRGRLHRPPLPQPAGHLDLGWRGADGLRRRLLAHRPPPPRRRADHGEGQT